MTSFPPAFRRPSIAALLPLLHGRSCRPFRTVCRKQLYRRKYARLARARSRCSCARRLEGWRCSLVCVCCRSCHWSRNRDHEHTMHPRFGSPTEWGSTGAALGRNPQTGSLVRTVLGVHRHTLASSLEERKHGHGHVWRCYCCPFLEWRDRCYCFRWVTQCLHWWDISHW